jgi:hypothetical protein
MALRDQPYLPLYIQDFLTDEKLIECSAKATGVYVRLMCIMHKSEEYGKILLKQKDKQTSEQAKNFACKLAKQMPYSLDVVETSLIELLAENVIHIEGDFLCQKRMIKDNALSLLRAKSGKKGGKFAQAKIKAKPQAKTEYETDTEYEDDNVFNKIGVDLGKRISVKTKYAHERPTIVYNLELYFESTDQLNSIVAAGWTDFDGFMAANPGAVFDDDGHVYNSFRKYSTSPKETNGKKKSFDINNLNLT